MTDSLKHTLARLASNHETAPDWLTDRQQALVCLIRREKSTASQVRENIRHLAGFYPVTNRQVLA